MRTADRGCESSPVDGRTRSALPKERALPDRSTPDSIDQLLGAIGHPVVVCDLNGLISRCTHQIVDLTGWSESDLIGRSLFATLLSPVDPARQRSVFQQVQRDGPWVGELPIRHKNGTTVLTHVRFTALTDDAGAISSVVGVFVVITAQRPAERHSAIHDEVAGILSTESSLDSATPRLLEAILHQLLEFAPDAIITVDAQGRILLANAQATRLFGYEAGELIGLAVEELIPENVRRVHLAHRQHYRARPRFRPMGQGLELAGRRKDGQEIPLEISLSPLVTETGHLVTAIVRDVSERRRAEARLRRSEAMLAEAQQIAQLGSWEWDIEQNTLVWSDALFRVYGLNPEVFEASYQGFLERVHPDDRSMVDSIIGQALENRRPFQFEHRIVRSDASVRVLYARGEVQSDDEGRPVRMVGTGQDITERREAEERERTLIREQAARAEAEISRSRLAFLADAASILTSSLDYETFLANLAELIVAFLADWCAIDSYREDGTIVPLTLAHQDPHRAGWALEFRRQFLSSARQEQGIPQVVRTGRSYFAPDLSDEDLRFLAHSPAERAFMQGLGARSLIAVPMASRDRVLGAITLVLEESGRRFSRDDLALAEDLARRAATAVEHALLYAAERHAASYSSRLLQITAALSEALTVEQVAAIAIEQAQSATGARGVVFYLGATPAALEPVDRVGDVDVPAGVGCSSTPERPGPVDEAVASGQPVFVESRIEVRNGEPTSAPTGWQAGAAVPLTVEGRTVGALWLEFGSPRSFRADDRELVLTLARQCAQVVERARIYELERMARTAAEQAMRVREEFLSIASHELKTPLTTLKGFVQLQQRLLGRDELDIGRFRSMVNQLAQQTARLEILVSDLLDVSRVQQGRLELRPEPIDLRELARAVVERARDSTERTERHEIVLEAPDPIPVRADNDRLDQVLTNLVSNALKYSPQGGQVVVAARRIGSEAELSVSDQGVGIPPEERAGLFEPFARGEEMRQQISGTGLGLYITRKIVEQHGGRIMVESKPGNGSIFRVRLPLEFPNPAPPSGLDIVAGTM